MKQFILAFIVLVSASCSKDNFDGRNDILDITFDPGTGVGGDYSNAACLAIQRNGQIIVGKCYPFSIAWNMPACGCRFTCIYRIPVV